MSIEIVPFRIEHLDEAAALLAARVQQECATEPHLSERFADPARARARLQDRLDVSTAGAVVALQHGRVQGYMLATYFPGPGNALFPYRRAGVRYHDHAAIGEERGELYRTMYAALSPAWLAAGYFCHIVYTPSGDRDIRDAWMSIGFGEIGVDETGDHSRATCDAASGRGDSAR